MHVRASPIIYFFHVWHFALDPLPNIEIHSPWGIPRMIEEFLKIPRMIEESPASLRFVALLLSHGVESVRHFGVLLSGKCHVRTACALPITSQRSVPKVISCPKLEMPKEQTRINPYWGIPQRLRNSSTIWGIPHGECISILGRGSEAKRHTWKIVYNWRLTRALAQMCMEFIRSMRRAHLDRCFWILLAFQAAFFTQQFHQHWSWQNRQNHHEYTPKTHNCITQNYTLQSSTKPVHYVTHTTTAHTIV